MRTGVVDCLGARGFHRMRYVEWGDCRAERVVICVHGLTRNGRDFDELARALPECRVICPDVVGRGASDWLDEKAEYGFPRYCADMATLIARVTDAAGNARRQVYWVGTSMGGIIGMLLAASPRSPIGRLVLNDVGALVPRAALERITPYVGRDPRFAGLRELEAHLRTIYAPFGPLTDAQWQHIARHDAREFDDGTWGLRYDPGIAVPLEAAEPADVDLWATYDVIRCPTLLVRGALSDLLLPGTAADMTRRGPRAMLKEFDGIGHAPMLMDPEQIAPVRAFLLDGMAASAP